MKRPADPEPAARYTITELAARSGLSTASIKFYLRERLLPSGDLRAEKRAYYDEGHLHRLLLIRALRELSKLPIDQIKQLLLLIDRGERSTFSLVASVVDALARQGTPKDRKLREQLHEKLTERGLDVRKSSATLDELSHALSSLRLFRPELDASVLDAYLDHLVPLARAEFQANRERLLEGPESALLGAIVGTVLFEPLITTLRKLAHEHFAKQMFDEPHEQPATRHPRRPHAQRPGTTAKR